MLHILPFEERKYKPGAIYIWCDSVKDVNSENIIGFEDVFKSAFFRFLASVPKIRAVLKKEYIKRVNKLVNGQAVWIHNDIQLALSITSCRIILHLHNFYIKNVFSNLAEINSKIAMVVSCSNVLKNKLLETGIDEQRLQVLRNGIFEFFDSSDWKQREIDYLFCGRLDSNKGFDIVYDLLKECDTTLFAQVIIAKTPMWDVHYLINTIKLYMLKIKFKQNLLIEHHLNHTEVIETLRKTKFLLTPTKYNEAFGLIALEGLASGCIVADSGIGGLAEVVPYSKRFMINGRLFLPQTIVDINHFISEDYSLKHQFFDAFLWDDISNKYSMLVKYEF